MNKLYSLLFCFALSLTQVANVVAQESNLQCNGYIALDPYAAQGPEGMKKTVVDGNLDCPENTVFSNPFDKSASMKSCNRSDQACQNGKSCVYVPFSSVQNPIHGVRAYGTFLDASFMVCDGRMPLDEDENITEPMKMTLGFWQTGDDGAPSELVYEETVEVQGEKSGARWYDGDNQHSLPVYTYTINLEEPLKLEHGWVSLCAADDGEIHDCCFCLISHSNATGGLNKFTDTSGYTAWYSGSFCYCFLGEADEALAQVGIKFNNLLSPIYTDNSKYSKVQVEVMNYGKKDVSNATLELYVDDKLQATEVIDHTIYSGWNYRYTFNKRIDLSGIGEHTVTVKNVTPDDEYYADAEISTTTECVDDVCFSSSGYYGSYKYIKLVKVGDIDNTSEYSMYSDYRDLSTDIAPGDTLQMEVDIKGANGDYLKVWVDWNGDGLFDGEGEFMGYVPSGTIDLIVPSGISASPGKKTMRIIHSNSDCTPYGYYSYGETEDYTLNLVRSDSDPAFAGDNEAIDVELGADAKESKTIEIGNTGAADLSLEYSVEYRLPSSPDVTDIRKAPAKKIEAEMPVIVEANSPAIVAPQQAPAAPEDAQYVLKYGKEYAIGAGASSTYVNFAHLYPKEMLKNISGMKITSIDVYIAEVAKKSYVSVWGEFLQNMNGEQIVKQAFTPVANSWNHIELDEPVTVGDQDLFVGVALEGCYNITNQIGLDNTAAIKGFGDLISINHSDYWWSLADLGYDRNVLIRTNVSGERTSAIDWLQLDGTTASLASGETATLTANVSSERLEKNFYEATINIKSNDPLVSCFKIPVYLTCTETSSVASIAIDDAHKSFTLDGRLLKVTGGKKATSITVYTPNGQVVAQAAQASSLSLANKARGLYLVRLTFDDGTSSSETFVIK